MNLNEVKKHVYFQTLIYIGVGICLLLSLFAILTTDVKAQEVSTNMTNSIYPGYVNNYGCNSGTLGRYCAIASASQPQIRSFNTRYNGVLQSIEFAADFSFRNNTTYTFDIYANSNDFRNNNVTASCYSYSNFPSQAVPIGCSYRYISRSHIQVIYPYNTYTSHEIHITGTQVTGDTNYSLKSVYVTYDDGRQDFTGVIDNATQNTTDIINNNNSNSQETQKTIFDVGASIITELANRCNNFIDMNNFKTGILHNTNGTIANTSNGSISNISNKTGSLTYNYSTAWNGVYYDFINIQDIDLYLNFNISTNGSTYLVKIDGFDENYNFISHNGYTNTNSVHLCSSNNVSVCNTLNVKYVRFSIETNSTSGFTLSNLRVNTNNGPFCVFGSTTSKLDEIGGIMGGLSGKVDDTNDLLEDQKDLQQEQNDYLMDDTNPSVDTNNIQNVLEGTEIENPLSYLLTLPLNLVQKINGIFSSGTCSNVTFGELYGTELYLPCINFENYLGSSLWGTIDVFVSIGLLAFTLYKLYQSVSNVLTLGAEKEIDNTFVYWTPMEFFANILGGNADVTFKRSDFH